MIVQLKEWLEQLIQRAKDLQLQNEQQRYQLIGERVAFESVLAKLEELSNGQQQEAAIDSDQSSSS